MSLRVRLVALAALALLGAACSGGGSSAPTTVPSTSTTPPSSAPSSTEAPSTTDAGTTTTTTAPVGPVYPLTGLPVTDAVAASRPALVVKIDNNHLARPQSGLNEADLVFEEIVEVQTRFAAVFQSQGADPVGPIRSGRTQDVDLLGSLDKPLFAWSGGNRAVTRAIAASDFVNLSAQKLSAYIGGGFFRSADRGSPHNLYASTTKLWTLAPAGAAPPPQQFHYLPSGVAATAGDAASGAHGVMDGLAIDWTYDPAVNRYLRTSDGLVHADALNGQVTTENVVVMTVQYRPSPADVRSPEAQTIGTGPAMVFTGGRVVHCTWSRPDRLSPVVLKDAAGVAVLLTPGRTWIELARKDSFSPRS